MVHVPAVGVVETRETSPPHIIETRIVERAPRLTGSAPWPPARAVVAPIDPKALQHDAGEATETLKRYVERVLPTDPHIVL